MRRVPLAGSRFPDAERITRPSNPAMLRRLRSTLAMVWLFTLVSSGLAMAQVADDFGELSLEELTSVRVILASRKEERVTDTPAAVFVLTHEEIRRSGATGIAEALRLVPGMQVARIDANKWAVSARGFNGRFANKLLVKIDGRTVYSSLFAGVDWVAHDIGLEEVERIEVIRGPGASLWGANAVNGIINIVTKNAEATQGTQLDVSAGTEMRGLASLRHGGQIGAASYRVFGNWRERDSLAGSGEQAPGDAWSATRGGFRLDSRQSDIDELTIAGESYDQDLDQTIAVATIQAPYHAVVEEVVALSGQHLQGRWQRTYSAASEIALQVYYDRTRRRDQFFAETRHTFDLDFQHRFAINGNHELTWGAGYLLSDDITRGTFVLSFMPAERTLTTWSAFVQDDLALAGERLRLVVGTKLEHNSFTAFEIQPTARVLWRPAVGHSVWAAVSYAIRTPSRAEADVRAIERGVAPGALYENSPLTFFGFESGKRTAEYMNAVEVGYRYHATSRLVLDVASFVSYYGRLPGAQLGQQREIEYEGQTYNLLPVMLENNTEADSRGVEISASWQASRSFEAVTTYSFLNMDSRGPPLPGSVPGENPQHQATLRAGWAFVPDWRLDSIVRYVDDLPSVDVDDYLEIDLQLAWQFLDGGELSVVGRNLLAAHHQEFAPQLVETPAARVQRGFRVQLRRRW